jgi:hypothetical protein
MNEKVDLSLSPKGIIFKSIGGFTNEIETGLTLELCDKITINLSRYMQEHSLRIEWVTHNGKDGLVFTKQTETH